MKSQSSMRNGRFHTPKHRGNLQKMGVLYTGGPPPPPHEAQALAICKGL
jgi:hypothetical protein